MTQSRTTRRTIGQWQTLVEQWQHSGQSARQFCAEQQIGYASFCQWRKRLTQDDGAAKGAVNQLAFVDLNSLQQSASGPGWHIVLRLGNGVELTLSQA